MLVVLDLHEDLPYLDQTPTEAERNDILSMINSEMSPDHTQKLHPSIPKYEPKFSSLISQAHKSISETTKPRAPDTGVDLTRYEEPSAPSHGSSVAEWRDAFSTANTSYEYLSARAVNLSLLERSGKNAWLISNSQVEAQLRPLENELGQVKEQILQLNEERRQQQENVRGQLESLDSTWRQTVGRAIEVEVAGEALRNELLDLQRKEV